MKSYFFCAPEDMIICNGAIRDKITVIKILVEVARFFTLETVREVSMEDINGSVSFVEDGKLGILVCVNKMSRIFLVQKNKIHTFFFPWRIKFCNGKIQPVYRDVPISSFECSVLASTFSNLQDDASIDFVLENYWDTLEELLVSESEREYYNGLVMSLLTFEAGYLRFDHDEERANGHLHPIDHCDVNYSNGVTFKLQLSKQFDLGEVIDMTDTTTNCHQISTPPA